MQKHQAEVERLRQELGRAQKTNVDHTDRYGKLKKQSDVLESKVQELKKIQDSNQAELKDLRTKLRSTEHERAQFASKQDDAEEAKKALQTLDSKRRDELRERDKKITDLEKTLAIEKKKRELLEARYSDVKVKVDEETQNAKDRAGELEKELQNANNEVSRTATSYSALQRKAEDTERELLNRLEQHRQLISRVAQEYGCLAASSVPKAEHDRVTLDLASSQLRVYRLDRKLANTEGQVLDLAQLIRQHREENHLLLEHLKQAKDTITAYSVTLRGVLKERPLDASQDVALLREFASVRQEAVEFDLAKERIVASDAMTWSNLYRHRSDTLLLHGTALLKHLDERDKQLQVKEGQLSAAEGKHADLQKSLATLRSEHDGLQQQLADTMTNLAETNGRLVVAQKERADVETHMKGVLVKVEQSLANEKEANRRLASTVQMGKQAEEALQAEIEQWVQPILIMTPTLMFRIDSLARWRRRSSIKKPTLICCKRLRPWCNVKTWRKKRHSG